MKLGHFELFSTKILKFDFLLGEDPPHSNIPGGNPDQDMKSTPFNPVIWFC